MRGGREKWEGGKNGTVRSFIVLCFTKYYKADQMKGDVDWDMQHTWGRYDIQGVSQL